MRKITGLLAGLILACAMHGAAQGQNVDPHANPNARQSAKPELQPVDFNQLDQNHDGKLSPPEARGDPGLYMDFDTLDVNRDGYLSMEEFQAWPRAKKAKLPDPGTVPGGSSGAQHLPQH